MRQQQDDEDISIAVIGSSQDLVPPRVIFHKFGVKHFQDLFQNSSFKNAQKKMRIFQSAIQKLHMQKQQIDIIPMKQVLRIFQRFKKLLKDNHSPFHLSKEGHFIQKVNPHQFLIINCERQLSIVWINHSKVQNEWKLKGEYVNISCLKEKEYVNIGESSEKDHRRLKIFYDEKGDIAQLGHWQHNCLIEQIMIRIPLQTPPNHCIYRKYKLHDINPHQHNKQSLQNKATYIYHRFFQQNQINQHIQNVADPL